MSDSLLFDIRPIEDEDGKRKKPKKKAAREEPVAPPVRYVDDPVSPGYMASLDVRCERCDLSVVDLVEVRRINGIDQWLVKCGWWCQQEWLIDPIPGVLDQRDKEQDEDAFVVRDGLFAGKTFDQIAAESHGLAYIRGLVKVAKRSALAEAAARWLREKDA